MDIPYMISDTPFLVVEKEKKIKGREVFALQQDQNKGLYRVIFICCLRTYVMLFRWDTSFQMEENVPTESTI